MSSIASKPEDLRILYFTVFLDMVAFAVILPALPFYAMQLGAGGLELGMLLASYSLAKLIGAAVVGRLSDRHGRRPLLIACLAGSAAAFVLTGTAASLLTLAASRAVAGLFGGTVGIAQAYAADITLPDERARHMGLIGASVGFGFILGPVIGVALTGFGFATVAFTGAALALANTALAAARVKRSPAVTSARQRPAPRLQTTTLSRTSRRVLAAMLLTVFAFVAMETTLAFMAHDRFALGQRGFGVVLVFVGVIMIIAQGSLVGRLVARLGERRVAVTGGALLGVAMTVLPLAPNLAVAFVVLGLLALGQGLVSPALAGMLSRATDPRNQGGMLGLGQSVASSARAMAPLLAGWLYDAVPAAPFLLGGTLSMVAVLSIFGLPEPSARR